MNNYKVYMHENKTNHKKYIGITGQKCNERWRIDGKGYQHQPKFYNAILKYGWDNFNHVILYDNLSLEEACKKEKELISQFDTCNNGYNTELGGNINTHSSETIEKIRQAMIGKTHTQKTKEKISKTKQNGETSVICIETGKQYISLAQAAKETGIDQGTISKCCRGINLRAGGYTWLFTNPERAEQYKQATEQRKDKSKKPVRCINTGQKYETITQAAKETHSDPSNIIKVCKGKYKTTNGLKWEYISEEEDV